MIEQNCLEKMILKPRLFPDAEQAQWRGVPCGNRVAKSNLNNTDTNFNQKGMPTGGETKRHPNDQVPPASTDESGLLMSTPG